VVKGAIVKSLGLYTEKPLLVKACPRRYGIKIRSHYAAYKNNPQEMEEDVEGKVWAKDQIRWFMHKGDVVFPDKPLAMTYDCHWSMKASDFPSAEARRNPGLGQLSENVFRDVVFVASRQDIAPSRFDELDPGKLSISAFPRICN